jgi:hypothetical protein
MSNPVNIAAREIDLVSSKSSNLARVAPVNSVIPDPMSCDENPQFLSLSELPESWPQVIENPRLWARLRDVLVDWE